MTVHVDAIYTGGVLRPKLPVILPEGAEVRISIETVDVAIDPLAGVLGIGDGPASGDAASHHDDYLYGESRS